MAVSTGTDICFICDYPGTENEVWSTSCAGDQDNLCTCSISDVSPGVQLCFTNFHSNCSGNYQCNASTVEPALACSAQARIVATSKSTHMSLSRMLLFLYYRPTQNECMWCV